MNGGNFKLGLFVITAIGLLVMVLLALGTLDRFKPSVRMETYFYGSIEGLQTGAAVKYNGVHIGRVGGIEFVAERYGATRVTGTDSAIMVGLILDAARLETFGLTAGNAGARASVAGEEGLRVRLATSGLGGPAFVEMGYLDPALYPAREVTWTPAHPVVPSAPSTITGIIGSLETILTELNDGKFATKLVNVLDMAGELTGVLKGLEGSDALGGVGPSLDALREASQAVSELVQDERLTTLLNDASATLSDARGLMAADDPNGVRQSLIELKLMAVSLQQASVSLGSLVDEIEGSGVIGELSSLSEDVGPTMEEAEALMTRLNALIGQNAPEIADAIRSLRGAALRLESLLEEAESNPSRMIFGEPPARRSGGGTP